MVYDSTMIGARIPGAVWVATHDGRQFRLEADVVVQEILPGSPLWCRVGGPAVHWSDWVRALR